MLSQGVLTSGSANSQEQGKMGGDVGVSALFSEGGLDPRSRVPFRHTQHSLFVHSRSSGKGGLFIAYYEWC